MIESTKRHAQAVPNVPRDAVPLMRLAYLGARGSRRREKGPDEPSRPSITRRGCAASGRPAATGREAQANQPRAQQAQGRRFRHRDAHHQVLVADAQDHADIFAGRPGAVK